MLKNKLNKIVALCILGYLPMACWPSQTGYAPLVNGSGKIISYQKKIANINAVEIDNSAELYIYQTKGNNQLTIEAEENIFPYLLHEIEGQTLKLTSAHNNLNPTKPIKYILRINKILTIVGKKNAIVICPNGLNQELLNLNFYDRVFANMWFNGDKLNVNLYQAAELTIGGAAKYQNISIKGSSNFNGTQLNGSNGAINITNSGTGIINVSEYLQANIASAGNLRYLGEPRLEIEQTQKPQITRLEIEQTQK